MSIIILKTIWNIQMNQSKSIIFKVYELLKYSQTFLDVNDNTLISSFACSWDNYNIIFLIVS